MSGLPRLTLSDLEDAGTGVAKQAVQASKSTLPRLTLKDIVPESAKAEMPFAEGNALEIQHPLGSVKLNLSGPEARFFAGAGKRLTGAGQRIKQLIGDKSVQADIDEAVSRDQPLMDTAAGQLGYMLPDVLAGLQPTNIPNTVRAAATQGGVSGLLTPLTTAEQEGYAGALNPVLGSLGAGAGQKVFGSLANAAGRMSNIAPTTLANMANSGLTAAGRGTRLPVPPMPSANSEAQALQELMAAKGVRTSIGDIDPTSAWRNLENMLEPVLGERRAFMTGQQDDLKRMLTSTQGAINKPVRDQAGNVVPDTFAMAQGIKDAYAKNKGVAKSMFDDVATLAGQPGVLPIKPRETLTAAQGLISEKPEYFAEMQDNPMWRKMLGVKRDADDQQSIILQHTGLPFMKSQELNFNEVKALRSALGAEFRDADKPSRKRAYAIMLAALDKDLDAWGQNTGNKALNAAYGDARSFYKQNVVPYTDPQANPSKSPLFSNIAVKDKVDSETVPKGVFRQGRQQLAQDFMDLSTPAGQQGAKNELINDVISSGLNPDTETGLSTAIIRHGSKYSAPGAAVFTPGEQAALEGSIQALKTTRRAASMPLSEPRNGVRIAPWAAGTALVGGASVPAFYGLNAMAGEDLSPTQRILMAFGALPLAGAIGAKGATKYTQSGLGKMLHFAEPQAQSQALGALQTLIRSGGRGAGSGLARGLQTEGLRLPQVLSGRDEEVNNEFNY